MYQVFKEPAKEFTLDTRVPLVFVTQKRNWSLDAVLHSKEKAQFANGDVQPEPRGLKIK
jgi:hypothetical protein